MSGLRDQIAKFAGKNAQVLGVSMDDLDTQKKFAESLKLPFPLAADPKGETAAKFGVREGGPVPELNSRATFVIGPDQKIVKVIEGKDAIDPNPTLEACPLHKPKKA